MRKFKAVIFDLDDTLYPEIEYVRSGFEVVSKYISKKFNIDYNQVFYKLLKLFEHDKKNVFNRLLELYGIPNEVAEKCIKLYRNHYPNIKLSEEVQKLLYLLKKNKFKIGIITDGRPEGQWNKIKALGLQKYCDSIIITDELGGIEYRKPCEIPYKKILQELGTQAKEAIYIGDNPAKDFITANRLGIFTIMFRSNENLYNYINLSSEYLAQRTFDEIIEIKKFLKLI